MRFRNSEKNRRIISEISNSKYNKISNIMIFLCRCPDNTKTLSGTTYKSIVDSYDENIHFIAKSIKNVLVKEEELLDV